MGPAYALLLLLALSASSLLALAAPGQLSAKAQSAIASTCSHTPHPDVCTSTVPRYAGQYSADAIDAYAVLNMQVDALAKRTAAARGRASQAARRAPPAVADALNNCDNMYMNTQDTIGAAERAATFRDKATTRIMLQLAVQDFESCDRPFKQGGMQNPMGRVDASLTKMANNCIALANMI